MKKFTFLVAALCATMMASATVFEKVTTAPADWSGQYLIVYENSATEAYVFNGQDAANGYVSATIAAGKIESTELDNYVATIAPMTGGYSVQIAGKYYGGKSGSNSLEIGSTAVLNTLSMEADNIVLLTSNTSVMRFNNAKDQKRFRYFKASSYTGQRGICLYKAKTVVDVEEPVIEEISVSKALELINALAEGASTTAEYIVKGVVSAIDTPNDTIAKYKNCDFWMSDIDAPASKVMAFRTKGIDGADFTVGLIAVGDTVKVQGTLKNFKNSKTSEIIPEINKGNLVEVVAGEGGEEGSAIRTVEIDNTVYARDGRIYAEEGARIYSLTGLDVTRMNGNLEGIYIVKNGNKVAKVAVAK